MKYSQLLILMLMVCQLWGFGDTTEVVKKKYYTSPITDHKDFKLDGILDDPAWNQVEWGDDFTIFFPNNGEKPTRGTKFKILYDNENIYVGYRCFDENPKEIVKRMSRRDGFPGDWVEINIDSYYDKSTGFSFTTSVSGVIGDEFITGNGNNWDTNWNPIWYAKTNIDEEGWTAEIKIPLSQLRYGDKEDHVWGFNIMRRDFRADERSTFQFMPQNAPGWVSNFAELHGISGIKPQRQVEIQPYVVTGAHTYEGDSENPFADGNDFIKNIGLDGKIGVTSDLTLDFTINPDFGQVEADPSALTLDGFQIFFDERRPFFIENANLFSFQVTGAQTGGPFNNDNLFYSRRIGQSPRGDVSVPDNAYTDYPDFTSILGAAKFSGKTKDGWSIGLLESITAEESMKISVDGNPTTAIVEPLSNYFVGRLSKDFKQGETTLGGTLTSVNRKLDGTGLEDQFHQSAFTGGVNVFHSWNNREWQLTGNFVFSEVAGSANKIESTQTSFEHYYQRPDADHLGVDPTRTSLFGHGGTVALGNYGGSDNISFHSGVTWRSPGLELNDIGFLTTADEINHFTWVGYRFPRPFSIFRRLSMNYNHFFRWDYGGNHTYSAFAPNLHASFTNYWNFSTGAQIELKDISTRALFGGPSLTQTRGMFNWIFFGSDSRKNFQVSGNLGMFNAWGSDAGAVKVRNGRFNIFAQVTDAFSLRISPSIFYQNRILQNVDYYEFNNNSRYLVGRVKQNTFSMSIRSTFNIKPNLTLEYWGQPFISKGNYSEFKFITDPSAPLIQDRYHQFDDNQISQSENESTYYIDEDKNGEYEYVFDNPDFNFMQWRSNMVLRWEYIPGSEFYLVWSQSTTTSGDTQAGLINSLTDNLFSESFDNTFLMKITYRFLN